MRRTIAASIVAFSITVIGALTLFAIPVSAGSMGAYDRVLVGKGDPAYDVIAVQDAVDKGGTVLLKGTFDFGKQRKVSIKNDIEIIGETDTQGVPLTKIKGGFWTFNSPLPSQESPPEVPGPKIAIRGLHFDGAVWTPLHFAYTSGAFISGNKITNVIPSEVPVKWQGGETLLWQNGAVFGTRFVTKTKLMPGAVTGNLVFENNEVDLSTDKPQITLGQGVFTVLTWGATIQIRGNVFTNVSRNSVESLDNYIDKEGRGIVIINDNKAVTPTVGIPFPDPSTPNGIVAGWFLDPSGGRDPARYSKIAIMGNYVEVRGDTSVGIAMFSDGAIMRSNEILVGGGSKAKGIVQLGSKGLIADNNIQGSGQCAVFTMAWKTFEGCRNTFVGNNISPFKASMAHVLLQGNNNLLVGACGKVVDKGEGNRSSE
jgi:hypothetical protein